VRRRQTVKAEVIDTELLPVVQEVVARVAPPSKLTPDEIRAEHEMKRFRLQAHIEEIERMTPEARYDAITAMTDDIQIAYQLTITDRMRWLDSQDPDIRAEGLEVIVRLQDAVNKIAQVRAQLYAALGLGERKGFVAGKEVPKLLIPSRTAEEFEREFGEAVKTFGPPKGVA